jgi:hypothetical protein
MIGGETVNTKWIKAQRSYAGGACVEVAWTHAAACASGDCVQVAPCEGGVMVRDSKDPGGPVLSFTALEWTTFRDAVKAGEFDDLGGVTYEPEETR